MKFEVDNMSCMHCEKKIRSALEKIGVKKIKIDLETKTVEVALKKVKPETVEETIMSIGYHFREI